MRFFEQQYDPSTFNGIVRALLTQKAQEKTCALTLSRLKQSQFADKASQEKVPQTELTKFDNNNKITEEDLGQGLGSGVFFVGLPGKRVFQVVHEEKNDKMLASLAALLEANRIYNQKNSLPDSDELFIPVVSPNRWDGGHIRLLHIDNKNKKIRFYEPRPDTNELLSSSKSILDICHAYFPGDIFEDVAIPMDIQTRYLSVQSHFNTMDCGPLAVRVLEVLLEKETVEASDFPKDLLELRTRYRQTFIDWKTSLGEEIYEEVLPPPSQVRTTMNSISAACVSTASSISASCSSLLTIKWPRRKANGDDGMGGIELADQRDTDYEHVERPGMPQ